MENALRTIPVDLGVCGTANNLLKYNRNNIDEESQEGCDGNFSNSFFSCSVFVFLL